MNKATPNPRRFSHLSPEEDPDGLAPLFQSAKAAPEEDLPRLYWRLRSTLRHQPTRARWLLRTALAVSMVFFTGGVLGAMLVPYWKRNFTVAPAETKPPSSTTPQPIRKRPRSMATKVQRPEPPASAIEVPQVADPVRPIPSHRDRPHLAAVVAPPPAPESVAPAQVPIVTAPPSPIAIEQALLVDILRCLHKQRDLQTALTMLEDHAKQFPGSVLALEADMLRVEALLGLGRNAEALAVLDHLSLGSMPNYVERLVVRGELRAAAGRWQEARADFESVLSTLDVAGMDPKSRQVKERALWGRASARSHLGDHAGVRADLALYLRAFPFGRFASQAAALLQGSP